MTFSSRTLLASTLCALVLVLASCGDPTTAPITGPMPDFQLQDVNPASITFADSVSPRQFLGEISAWYFGNAG